MNEFELTYKPFGAHSILIEWPQKIDPSILQDVLRFKNLIQKYYLKDKVYINSAYCSILISYTYTINNIYNEIQALKQQYYGGITNNNFVSNLWKIPVCYDEKFGIDLVALSNTFNIAKEEIIKLHSEVSYLVYFIGFLPGFLYLGGLDKKLHFPRKSSPRLLVNKGAVAIGGMQTGIYPCDSPGGWNIIGNSPVDYFNSNHSKPCFAQSGDRIKFYPVSKKQYEEIKMLVDADVYQLESEVIND